MRKKKNVRIFKEYDNIHVKPIQKKLKKRMILFRSRKRTCMIYFKMITTVVIMMMMR